MSIQTQAGLHTVAKQHRRASAKSQKIRGLRSIISTRMQFIKEIQAFVLQLAAHERWFSDLPLGTVLKCRSHVNFGRAMPQQ